MYGKSSPPPTGCRSNSLNHKLFFSPWTRIFSLSYRDTRDHGFLFCFSYILLGAVNLALHKPAEQISNLTAKFPASKAVNGVFDDRWDFSHTQSSDYLKWWKVDLETIYIIKRIELYNRPNPYFCKYYNSLIH